MATLSANGSSRKLARACVKVYERYLWFCCRSGGSGAGRMTLCHREVLTVISQWSHRQAAVAGNSLTGGKGYLPDCIQVSLPKGGLAAKRGRELGVWVWVSPQRLLHTLRPHMPLWGIENSSLATDTELGKRLGVFLSKWSQLRGDKPDKANCALLWEGKKWLICSKSRSPSQLHVLVSRDRVGW